MLYEPPLPRKLPAVHDPITIALGGQRSSTNRVARVFDDVADWSFRVAGSMAHYTLDDEGVLWIRGHHPENSAEVAALLAACSLAHSGKLERWRQSYSG